MQMFKSLSFCLLFACCLTFTKAQNLVNADSVIIRKIYDEALLNGQSYKNLHTLCKDVGNRLSGSANAEKAVSWGFHLLTQYKFDSVWLQPVMVPKWVRGKTEILTLLNPQKNLHITALGGSVGTNGPLAGKVMVFNSINDLKLANTNEVTGKIVLLNQSFDPRIIDPFNAYGPCASQRFFGAVEAAKKGAIACLVRSAGGKTDFFPHTGVTFYSDTVKKIPSAAIATADADFLVQQHLKNQDIEVLLSLSCTDFGMVTSHNVIAQITGTDFPDEIIVVGGHLDSWDLGEGAHDDGAGVVHAIEALRLFKTLGIKPKHTIRCVLFMNEENGNNGGKTYAQWVKKNNQKHIAAIESDRGGFAPRGFTFDAHNYQIMQVKAWEKLLEPYHLHIFKKGYGGVDIGPLKNDSIALIGFMPDPQRYFDFHHTENDVFENVHQRELELGCAAITSLLFLIDKYKFLPKE